MEKLQIWIKAISIGGLLLLLSTSAALGGGWAVITLESLPGELRAGEPFTIEFSVRQHGVTPMADLEPTIRVHDPETGQITTLNAEPGTEIGDYTVALTLPTEGLWNWSIEAFTMDQAMPPLDVLPTSAVERPGKPNLVLTPIVLMSLSLLGLLAAIQAFRSRRFRWGYGIAALSLIAGAFGVQTFTNQTSSSAQAASVDLIPATADAGEALFISKGCLTCHDHSRAEVKGNYYRISIGPNLSKFTASPKYLRPWLSDPQAFKPKSMMPNLDLTDDEIEALIAFLNAD